MHIIELKLLIVGWSNPFSVNMKNMIHVISIKHGVVKKIHGVGSTNMEQKINTAIKLVLELLRETNDKENKYHLVQAHNELMKVYNKYENPRI